MKNILFLLIILCGPGSMAQSEYPQDYFQAPLGIDMYLAGNFAELRSNHFHTGIDIKTNNSEGYKLYACADGYVSRINVSPWGYGNAIYIDHPNGYTTVYAHMQGYNEEIDAFIKEVQYYKQQYDIEVYPGKEQLPVKQGDVIGYSGNTGGSTAPHLHFEIRDTETEEPINPLLFGLDIADEIKPEASEVRIYPLAHSTVNGQSEPQSFTLTGSNGSYKYNGGEILVNGEIGLAVNTIDKLNGVSNKCGIYTIELYVDDEKIFKQEMERLDFSTNRFINCHMDYELYKTDKKSFHKSYVVDNNQLPIYAELVNNGHITVDYDADRHDIRYVIRDAYGNETEVTFSITPDKTSRTNSGPEHTAFWAWDEDNTYTTNNVAVYLPSGSLYEDLYFNYTLGEQPSGTYSPIHWIHDMYTGVQNHYTVKINVGEVDEAIQDKLVVVLAWKKGSGSYGYSAKGGDYDNGWMSTRVRDFGGYTVMLDTVAPVITPNDIGEGYDLTKKSYIELDIADNLSGIASYNGYVDGNWVLFEYEPKTDLVRYYFDETRLEKTGELHELLFQVTDERGNIAEYSCNFKW